MRRSNAPGRLGVVILAGRHLGAPRPPTTAPTVTAPTATAPPTTDAPTPTDAPLPPPVIEIDYQVPEGSTGTATIDGPSGHLERALDTGVAVFDGLPEGVYDIVVSRQHTDAPD